MAKLPKSKLFWLKALGHKKTKFAKFRGANWAIIWLFGIEIGWRMPWLEASARALHPEITRDE